MLHPARMHGINLKEAVNEIDVIEALTGKTQRLENLEAKNLTLRFNKPVITGSDAHLGFEIGRVRTVFEDASNTLEDLRKDVIDGERMLVDKRIPLYCSCI